jgi:flagellar basal body-associated protein FliL
MVEAHAPRSLPSKGQKILKWVLIGIVVAVLAAVAAVMWILHSLGPMPSFG